MNYRLEWRLVGRARRLLDSGDIDGGFADRPSALRALNAFLLTFAVQGRNEAEGYWWGRRSEDADIEVQVSLRQPLRSADCASASQQPFAIQGPAPILLSRPANPREVVMTTEERALLCKAAADPNGQIAIKRRPCGAWHADRDRLDRLARRGHLAALGERMGPHLGGTFSVWQITPAGRAIADRAGSADTGNGGSARQLTGDAAPSWSTISRTRRAEQAGFASTLSPG